MKTNIDFEKLENDAEEIFNSGFACSESVIYAINKNLELGISDDAIAMSSGFPWGLGGPGCLCGALAGGTMSLGQVFGRRTPGDPKIKKCFELTEELHNYFVEQNGAACCGRIIAEFDDRNDPKRKCKCTALVRSTVRKVAEIIIRESE